MEDRIGDDPEPVQSEDIDVLNLNLNRAGTEAGLSDKKDSSAEEHESLRVDPSMQHDSSSFFEKSAQVREEQSESLIEPDIDVVPDEDITALEDALEKELMLGSIPDPIVRAITETELEDALNDSIASGDEEMHDLGELLGGIGEHSLDYHTDVTIKESPYAPEQYQVLSFSTDPADIGDSGLDGMWINDWVRAS